MLSRYFPSLFSKVTVSKISIALGSSKSLPHATIVAAANCVLLCILNLDTWCVKYWQSWMQCKWSGLPWQPKVLWALASLTASTWVLCSSFLWCACSLCLKKNISSALSQNESHHVTNPIPWTSHFCHSHTRKS